MAHGEGAVLCDLAPAFFPSPIVLTAPPSASLSHLAGFLSDLDASFAPSGHGAFAHAVLVAGHAAPAPPILAAASSGGWLSPPYLGHASSPLSPS